MIVLQNIISHPYRAIASRYVKMLNIDIPVIFDSSSYLKTKYGINHTPGRIIINNKNEIIHRSDVSNKDFQPVNIINTIKVHLKSK